MAMNNSQVLAKIRQEYEEGRSYLEPKKQRWVNQLTLMNNLQRGVQNIASTTLFSFFNRVFANLYSNVMSSKFVGNDAEMRSTESLNTLYKSDSQEMDKATLDYDWLWDACFYGAGYIETLVFDKKRKLMKPTVLNPLFFSYDPFFSEVQKWRYYDKWILRSKHEIDNLIDDGIITGIKRTDELASGVDPYIWTWKIQAELAKDVNPPATDTMVPSSGVYQILEHATYIDGNKYFVWTDKDITMILRKKKLDLNDDPDRDGESLWPIVKKVIFKEPHSSATLSIPDLLEDKHRALNVMLNLAYISIKDEVNPIYEYVPEQLQNPAQLFQRNILQHIAVNELGKAIQPIKTKTSLSASSLQFLNILKQESSDAIGSAMPPMQGAKKGKSNSAQDQMMQMLADLVTSLQTKIVANAEAEFCSMWYQRYINNIEDGDTKMAVITDALGSTFQNIQLDKIKTKYPPRVVVSSSKEAEYKEQMERKELAQQFGLIQGAVSPDQFKMFLKQFWFPKFKTFDLSSIDLVFPPSLDELKAQKENEILGKSQWAEVQETDDHVAHLYLHSRGKKTAEMNTHIIVHEFALAKQKQQAMDQAKAAAQAAAQGGGGAGSGGAGASGSQGGAQGGTGQGQGGQGGSQQQQTPSATQAAIPTPSGA